MSNGTRPAPRRQRGRPRVLPRPRRHTRLRAHEKRVPASDLHRAGRDPGRVPARPLRRRRLRLSASRAARRAGTSASAAAARPCCKDVQRLLSAFGDPRAHLSRQRSSATKFAYTRTDGTTVEYESRKGFDLRITGADLERFAARDRLLDAAQAGRARDAARCESSRYATEARTRRSSRARTTARRSSTTSPSRSTTRTSSTASSSRTAREYMSSTTRPATSPRST